MIIHLSVDVYCSYTEGSPVYRIYVDNEMLTERTFRWPSYQNYIREHMIVDLPNGTHSVKVINCSDRCNFKLGKCLAEGVEQIRTPGDTEHEYTFTV